jgi:hypothetical protein
VVEPTSSTGLVWTARRIACTPRPPAFPSQPCSSNPCARLSLQPPRSNEHRQDHVRLVQLPSKGLCCSSLSTSSALPPRCSRGLRIAQLPSKGHTAVLRLLLRRPSRCVQLPSKRHRCPSPSTVALQGVSGRRFSAFKYLIRSASALFAGGCATSATSTQLPRAHRPATVEASPLSIAFYSVALQGVGGRFRGIKSSSPARLVLSMPSSRSSSTSRA